MNYCSLLYITPKLSQLIEICGRLCYRSERKIDKGSADKLIRGLVNSGHLSVLEHSNIVISINENVSDEILALLSRLPTISLFVERKQKYIIRMNMRHVIEMLDLLDNKQVLHSNLWNFIYSIVELVHNNIDSTSFLFEYISGKGFPGYSVGNYISPIVPVQFSESIQIVNADDYHPSFDPARKLSTVTLIIDMPRQMSLQFVRHRISSYSQESQRYVDQCDRFDYYTPDGIDDNDEFVVLMPDGLYKELKFRDMMSICNAFYKSIREAGFKPEIARNVLPENCKTRIAVTRTIDQWLGYFNLRLEAGAQFNIRSLSCEMLKAIQSCGYLTELKVDDEKKVLIRK